MESAFPPSYEEATTTDHWPLVARYIFGSDLCAACLVSKGWHATFAPFLWGNPAGHFGTENDRVYVALTRFKRALPTASLQVRQLTHTLHLPPALSEIYDGPKAEWLRDVLERLPNLQSLLVSQLPFFDHSALHALRRPSRSRGDLNDDQPLHFHLKLLIASSCSNATSAGLTEALLHLPKLVFLDLSETTAARDRGALRNLRHMRGLQVLKLRSIGLRDDDVNVMADAIQLRVRSLDVSNNRLTDASVETLLSKCMHSQRDVHSQHSELRRNHRSGDDWPTGLPMPHDSFLTQLRGINLDEKFLQRLTKPGAGRIIIEDLPAPGITHLYISNNFVSVAAVASLIRTENLHVLDVAALDAAKISSRAEGSSALTLTPLTIPNLEQLATLLAKHGSKNLTFLRINHAVVTRPAAARESIAGPSELDGCQIPLGELQGSTSQASELDSTANALQEMIADVPIFELSADVPSPKYEKIHNPLHSRPRTQTKKPVTYTEPADFTPKRDAIFAPEVVESTPPTRPVEDGRAPSEENSRRESTTRNIWQFEQRREQLRSKHADPERGLLPGSLPALSTLVLTEVPAMDNPEGTVVTALRKFITDCALESELADSQATLEFPTVYVPGKRRAMNDMHRSHELFALQQIVLELSPRITRQAARRRSPSESSGSPLSPSTPIFRTMTSGFNQAERSSTGDPDTEAFWKAQENDFSFFGEEECGLPLRDTSQMRPRRTVEEKMAITSDTEDIELLSPTRSSAYQVTSSPQTLHAPEVEGRDVVTELARWRREKKRQAEQLGNDGSSVAGHWKGEIKIVRPEFSKQKGYVDWYGNYFEKGVYR